MVALYSCQIKDEMCNKGWMPTNENNRGLNLFLH